MANYILYQFFFLLFSFFCPPFPCKSPLPLLLFAVAVSSPFTCLFSRIANAFFCRYRVSRLLYQMDKQSKIISFQRFRPVFNGVLVLSSSQRTTTPTHFDNYGLLCNLSQLARRRLGYERFHVGLHERLAQDQATVFSNFPSICGLKATQTT